MWNECFSNRFITRRWTLHWGPFWERRARIQKEDRGSRRSDRMSREPRGIYWSGDQCPWLAGCLPDPPCCFRSRSNEIAPKRLDLPTRSCRTAKVRACRVFSLALSLLHSHVKSNNLYTRFLLLLRLLRLGFFSLQCQCVICRRGDMWFIMAREKTWFT